MLTHPDRILFPKTGHTKQDVADYYKKIAPRMLPYMVDRPVSLVRAPGGVEETRFYQRHPGEYFPDYIERVRLKVKEGYGVYILIDSYEDIEYLVNLGTIEFHIWGSKVSAIEVPTIMIFDLDPAPDIRQDQLLESTQILKDLLVWEGYKPYIKTSGVKGYHIGIPLTEGKKYQEIHADAHQVAERLAAKYPKLFVAGSFKEDRKGRIFIDYLRNSRSATNVAPYSLRGWHEPTVSCPFDWNDIAEISPRTVTIDNYTGFLADSERWV